MPRAPSDSALSHSSCHRDGLETPSEGKRDPRGCHSTNTGQGLRQTLWQHALFPALSRCKSSGKNSKACKDAQAASTLTACSLGERPWFQSEGGGLLRPPVTTGCDGGHEGGGWCRQSLRRGGIAPRNIDRSRDASISQGQGGGRTPQAVQVDLARPTCTPVRPMIPNVARAKTLPFS